MENIYSVLITVVTMLGGTTAWRYYEKRADKQEKDDSFVRDDCRDRIAKLEALLELAGKEKDEMRKQILELSTMVAKLQTQIQYLTDNSKRSI